MEEEDTTSSFMGVKDGIEAQAYLPASTRTGAAIHAAGLGIEMIAACSPEARGRSERMFRTHQERLPRELLLTGITDRASVNH